MMMARARGFDVGSGDVDKGNQGLRNPRLRQGSLVEVQQKPGMPQRGSERPHEDLGCLGGDLGGLSEEQRGTGRTWRRQQQCSEA